MTDKTRLDKWLWAARFFKTRGLATEAIDGGHVHVNGARVKPSRTVNIGDELRIRKTGQEFVVVVRDISDSRGPATAARTLYEETHASLQAREQQAAQQRLTALASPKPAHRPGKRDRRHIIRFTRQG